MLEWIVSSSLLILVVLVLRAALGKRISAVLRYGLWSVVLVRLLVPVAFFTLAVTPLPAVKAPEALHEESIYVLPVDHTPVEESGVRFAEDGTMEPFGDPGSFGYARLEDEGRTVTRYAERISPLELLGWIWAAGTAVMALVLIIANTRFASRLRRVRRPLEGTAAPVPVYVAPGLPSPCLTGLFRPAVYVTEEAAASPAMLRHVLAHELTHYNHRDHLWSVLRGAALAVHWWNPLVWLAVVCSRRDGELACDEGALKQLGDGERTAYGETLLALVTAKSKPADLLSFATTMTGGKRSLRERIQRIARQPKRLAGATAVVVIVLSLSALAAFGQAKEADAPDAWNREAPESRTSRPDNAWRTAVITLNEDGVPYIDYQYGNTAEFLNGEPIPAPRAWEGQSEKKHLTGSPEVWAKLVSPNDGWLVACYEQGAAAETYVYKTADGGMTWTEAAMPGTGGQIADVGFLRPDRLIVARKPLNGGAPCLITRDGGETWEETELPDAQVLSIVCNPDNDVVFMQLGELESGRAAGYVLSHDLGDTWTLNDSGDRHVQADLDHDGVPEDLGLYRRGNESFEMWTLLWLSKTESGSKPYYDDWTDRASTSHVEWKSFFLCRQGGEDYLLRYTPYMGGGVCRYAYQLFYLAADGEEVVVQENSVEFDIIFSPDYAEQHQYDPWAINAFMEEINALLADSELLLSTDQNLQATFEKEGRLYDSLWWLDDEDNPRNEDLTLLDNLLNYANYAQDHPDDVWSPLADLLQNLTEDDMQGDPAILSDLVPYLRTAKRGSRFYTWDSAADAYDGHGVGERPAGLLMELRMRDTSPLHLFANLENDSVLMMLDTGDQVFSAFYSAPELCAYIADFPVHVRPFSSTEPDINELLAHITKDGITSMGGGRGIIPRADIASALNSVSEKAAMSSEDREPETGTNGYKVWYHDDSYNWHILLEAGETTGDVYLTFEGTTMTPAILENPDPADLQSTPYKVVGFVNDETLYQLVVENR